MSKLTRRSVFGVLAAAPVAARAAVEAARAGDGLPTTSFRAVNEGALYETTGPVTMADYGRGPMMAGLPALRDDIARKQREFRAMWLDDLRDAQEFVE